MMAAQQASRAKTDFIANISHELRTPMNGILGLASLLKQSRMDDKQQEMLGMLTSSAETQMHLIGDLLDISSIENGHLSLNLGAFSPSQVVLSVCALFEIEAAKKGLSLRVEIEDGSDQQVIGDKERYRQVCTNIVSNAVKFTTKGDVSVSLRQRARLGEAVFTLEVLDTGAGIHPDDQAQIFDRFAQGRSKQTGKAAGTGLGLSITRTIVEIMGGTVSVSSELDNGSCFVVEIPFELSNEAASANAA